MQLLTTLLYCLTIFYNSEAKIFKRCEFVHQLVKHGVPDWQIPTLTCLAKWESGFDSGKLDYQYGKHGVFQINEKVWCSPLDYPGRECETTCSNFRDKHLGDDITCALKIYKDTLELSGIGYDAWDSYWEHCASSDNVDYIKNCY